MSQSIDKNMQRQRIQIFIYAALPCEAKPLVEHFKLKKDTSVKPFNVYFNNDIYLTVTGIGKCAMSAGVAYTQAVFKTVENPVLLNVGIAGHRYYALGSVYLIDKIIDGDSGKNYYPPLVFTPPCSTAAIQTSSRPQLNYDHSYLCDMEASAFYDAATRFSPLTQVNKGNVAKLRPAWIHLPGRTTRGIQSTPIVMDGSLYYSTPYSRVHKLNAATGERMWVYTPELNEMVEAFARPTARDRRDHFLPMGVLPCTFPKSVRTTWSPARATRAFRRSRN